MFEKASRKKFRFNYKGLCTTEDLWDINIEDLDNMYKSLRKELKETQEEGLLKKKTARQEELTDKIAIISHIVKTRLVEREQKAQEADRKIRKQKLLSILAEKQDEKIRAMSAEEIEALIDEL